MIIILFSVAALMPHVIAQSCYYQRCIGCTPEQGAEFGTPTQCQLNNVVTPLWLPNPLPPIGGIPLSDVQPSTAIQYRCLQMVATPDDSSHNTVDRIRGCVPQESSDVTCAALEAVQKLRGHNDVRCFTCDGDNCNSVGRIAAPLHFALLLPLLFFIFS